jgi:hypothetical protein
MQFGSRENERIYLDESLLFLHLSGISSNRDVKVQQVMERNDCSAPKSDLFATLDCAEVDRSE